MCVLSLFCVCVCVCVFVCVCVGVCVCGGGGVFACALIYDMTQSRRYSTMGPRARPCWVT